MNTRKTTMIFLRTMIFMRTKKHLQFLATEFDKSTNKLNPQFIWCFFPEP